MRVYIAQTALAVELKLKIAHLLSLTVIQANPKESDKQVEAIESIVVNFVIRESFD